MRRILLLLIILTPLINISQTKNVQTFTVSGKIIDAATKIPLEDATIIFKKIDSNAINCGTITNARGNFSIDVKEGTYDAFIEFISYKSKNINISSINRNLNIGTIALEVDTEFLDEVEIIGEKKAIEFRPNKIVFHVDKDIAAAGGVATDVLNNIPSVSVDPDGSVTVQGQGNVQVMINGKSSSLTKTDALKSLPAGSIENIEVITSPGAQYKASALSIINIILKKGKDEGLNASITATAGFKDYYGSLITLNSKTKKINFFTNASFNHSNPIIKSFSENEYFANNITTSFLNESSEFNSKNNAFYGTIGSDFYLSNRTTLTTSINFQNINQKRNTLTKSSVFDEYHLLFNSNDRYHAGIFDNDVIEFVVDFEHNFKKEGQKITSFINYTKDVDNFNNTITNSNINYTNEEYVEKNTWNNKVFDIKLENPIGKSSKYTIGYNGEFEKIPFTYTGTNSNNNIDYTKDVHAAFIEYEYEAEKFYLGIGLRGEFAETSVNYQNLNSTQTKQFNEFAPSIYLQYSFNDLKSLSLSYNNVFEIPDYYRLQPFEQKYSETSSFIGNPDLNPINIDNYSLGYLYYGNKLTFAPSLSFIRYKNYWQDVTYETGVLIDGADKIISTIANVGTFDMYGVSVNVTYKPKNILNFSGSINIYNYDQKGIFKTINTVKQDIILDFNHASINGNFSLLTQLEIPNAFDLQINAVHYLESKGAYSVKKAYTYASAAVNKDLFNNKASISLTVDDVFKSRETNRNRFNTNYFSKSLINNKYRTVLLSFTYRFNQSKKDRKIDFERKENKPNY
jgi:outer membrane receptor protein involved in Fe transport